VSSLYLTWNTFFDNLLKVYQKLKEQGFLYYNGTVQVLEQDLHMKRLEPEEFLDQEIVLGDEQEGI